MLATSESFSAVPPCVFRTVFPMSVVLLKRPTLAHIDLLRALFNEAATSVDVVGSDLLLNLGNGETVGDQLGRVEDNLVLARRTSKAGYIYDAGDGAKAFSRVQSSILFRAIVSYLGFELSSVYQKICPTGLHLFRSALQVRWQGHLRSRSSTFSRFQSFTLSSSKIMVTLERPARDVERRCAM